MQDFRKISAGGIFISMCHHGSTKPVFPCILHCKCPKEETENDGFLKNETVHFWWIDGDDWRISEFISNMIVSIMHLFNETIYVLQFSIFIHKVTKRGNAWETIFNTKTDAIHCNQIRTARAAPEQQNKKTGSRVTRDSRLNCLISSGCTHTKCDDIWRNFDNSRLYIYTYIYIYIVINPFWHVSDYFLWSFLFLHFC